jgi:tetratricopeptide (TPR) repeat protein
MTQRSERPFVGRADVQNSLVAAYASAADGPHTLLLDGAPGVGRRAVIGQAMARLGEQGESPVVLRLRGEPADDSVRTLLRIYGSFVTGLARSGAFGDDGADALLHDAANSVADDRVAEWLRQIAHAVYELKNYSGPGNYQIQLPPENPYLGLLHALDVLGPRCRWIVDLFELGSVTSSALWVFLSALVGRARARNWKVLFLVTAGPNRYAEKGKDGRPGPRSFLGSLFGEAETLTLEGLTVEEVAELLADTYRPNRFPEKLAARLHKLSTGHPDTLHELLDALEEDETITWDDEGYDLSDLEDVDFDVIVPMAAESDDDEDDDEDAVPAETKEKVLHVAAHAGRTFVASAIRSYLDVDEDVVDDALDDMDHIVEEVRYDNQLGSWLYRFRYAFFERWFRDTPPDGWKVKGGEIDKALGTVMMQSYAPASFDYVPRAAELFARAGEGQGARALLQMAMNAERPELSEFALQIVDAFEDSPYPDGLVRYLHTSMADRATNTLQVPAAETIVERTRAWADSELDLATQGYCDLLACRLQVRQGKFDEAKELGLVALKAFEEAGDATRQGEVLNQLAMVELNRGDRNSAATFVKRATKATTIPPVRAHTQYILGLIDKSQRKVPQALANFTRATELSSRSGNLALSLESMLNEGEMALMMGQVADRAPMLERAMEMSRAMRSPQRERVAARLLCQAEAARGHGESALEIAQHALKLTQELGLEQQEDVDLYHCGLFAVLAGKKDEGVEYLKSARSSAEKNGNQGLLPEILFNLGQVKLAEGDFEGARGQMEQALGLIRAKGDKRRELQVLQHLGLALGAAGDLPGAVARLQEASDKAVGPQFKEFRKSLRKQIAEAQKAAAAAGAQASPTA